MKRGEIPKITFGIIVLNGNPFIIYNLRALYPFAHQIIVVEGASPGAANIATPDGHSTDGTLQAIYEFKDREDPQNKLIIFTAEDEGYANGFWPGEKHEQSQAYAKRATGDYLWQVDVDEFYRPEDMHTILKTLQNDKSITALSFQQFSFWGGFDYVTDGWFLRRGWCKNGIHRVFKWGPGYYYASHRPVTVCNAQGVDLRCLHWMDGTSWAQRGIFMYHYSLLFPKQVIDKCEYYKNADWETRCKFNEWADKSFHRIDSPYHVHNVYDYPSWLERFTGNHPLQIEILRNDLQASRLNISMRPIDDIERLLHSTTYQLGRAVLKLLEPVSRWWRPGIQWRQHIRRFTRYPGDSIKKLSRKLLRFKGMRIK
jgi:hypothetical protein